MAASPRWKVYTYEHEYVASCTRPLYAAMIVAGIGHAGTTIRDGHPKRRTVFTDGAVLADGSIANAAESYDRVAEICVSNAQRLGRNLRAASMEER